MAELKDYSTSAGSNNSASPNGWPESMAPSGVNNSDRELAARIARWLADNNGSLATGGTSTAITVTLNQQFSAWFDGLTFAARITTTNGATPTINPTGSGALGAKSLYWAGSGAQLAAGDLVSTSVAGFCYEATSNKVYVFAAPPYSLNNLLTTRGDLAIRDASTPVRLAIGAANTVLGSDGTDPSWGGINNAHWSGTDLAVANGGTGASNASDARTNLGVAIGSDVQAYSANLAAIAALAVTDNNIIVGNGTTWVAESGATARTSLGAGDVVGPASATDNALARFDATTGKLLQDSVATMTDAGALTIAGTGATQFSNEGTGGVVAIRARRTDTHGDVANVAVFRGTGKDDAGNDQVYGGMWVVAVQDANGTETGRLAFSRATAGTDTVEWLMTEALYAQGLTEPAAQVINAAGYEISGRIVKPFGCWGYVTVSAGTPTLQDSDNVTSITDTATGQLTVTIATDHANANYAAPVTLLGPGGGSQRLFCETLSKAVGSFVIHAYSTTGTFTDPSGWDFGTVGDF